MLKGDLLEYSAYMQFGTSLVIFTNGKYESCWYRELYIKNCKQFITG